mmetsp:Transcript_9588/g.21966  ORF Transcript_9588/g.21966 Transcript_9588/m.21966 type:complete len:430 (-) Transcript_9588:39-1328(-)
MYQGPLCLAMGRMMHRKSPLAALTLLLRLASEAHALPPSPGPVQLSSVGQVGSSMVVEWLAPAGGADMVEVQVAAEQRGPAVVIMTSSTLRVQFDMLLPNVTYWVRARAHAKDHVGYGPGHWGPTGPELAFRLYSTASQEDVQGRSRSSEDTFFIEVVRESEYTTDVDYLVNHNSGDALGVVALLSTVPVTNFSNFSMENTTVTVYCVEVLNTSIPDTVTTAGNDRFSDYVSCNYDADQRKVDPGAPSCHCENFVDRLIGGQKLDGICFDAETGGACNLLKSFFNLSSCACRCSASSRNSSAQYTGMQPIMWGAEEPYGRWYSHPAAGECHDWQEVGDRGSTTGEKCTWKRHSEARLLRKKDLLRYGWNSTVPSKANRMRMNPLVVRQNEAAFWRTFSKLPLRPWSCEDRSKAFSASIASAAMSQVVVV